uniref:Iron hydrogenase large subunit C-terminal domain-containing protein n=1 Tax=Acrobeloides nanus TaxID=290746 RepID=A0A914DDV0_9BILA
IFTFIKAYGFRNLRDILRKLKKQQVGKNVYFIEIMACPSACGSGGGQIRAEKETDRKLLSQKVQEEYSMIKLNHDEQSEVLKEVDSLIEEWQKLNADMEKLFYTEFHSVPKNANLNDW